MLGFIRRHLSLKLFLSYLVIIVVGVAVLATAAELAVPTAFERHMAAMAEMMGGTSIMWPWVQLTFSGVSQQPEDTRHKTMTAAKRGRGALLFRHSLIANPRVL